MKGLLRYGAMVLLLAFVLIMAGCGSDVGEDLLGGTWHGDPQDDGDHLMYIEFGPTREFHPFGIGNISSYEVEVTYFYDVTVPLDPKSYTWKVLLPGLGESVAPIEVDEADALVSKPTTELCTLLSLFNKHTFTVKDPGKSGTPYLVLKGEYIEDDRTFDLDVYVGDDEEYKGITFKLITLPE